MTSLHQQPRFVALQEFKRREQAMSLAARFAEDPERFSRFCFAFGSHLRVDLSRQHWSSEVQVLLCELARDMKLGPAIAALFGDNLFNHTEGRAALHTALRMPVGASAVLDGVNVVPQVHVELARLRAFCDRVHTGEWRGFGGQSITDVVNIGIGGSDLGPAMVVEALAPYQDKGIRAHFVSNMDGAQLASVLAVVDPARTLFVISSKTFTTDETMTNARAARAWLLAACNDPAQVKKHFVAVSTNAAAVQAFGISPEHMFEFWSWVGGRFSLWSAIGLPIALALGFERFEQLLAGAHEMDEHLRHTPFEQNIPVLLALLSIWNINVLGLQSEGIFPYSHHLKRFPAYLQQLNMESNGKGVNNTGEKITHNTGPIVWGEVGTNGQHAFFQLLHQGSQVVPAEFIGFARSCYDYPEHHRKLLANMLAQAQALAFGKDRQQVEAELAAEGQSAEAIAKLAPYKVMDGNRPSTTILCDEFNPHNLGALIALYEHKTFVQGMLWNINSFDQWGVELGKKLAARLIDDLADDGVTTSHDSATNGLLAQIKAWR
ncbi:glucose-6-phosphate isomerase [Oceanisphaera arctica]|uniref:Glucose-6-phosphate isomerase n=1 Tax=Oceanisphaera arctica TaxID=641510 RepID=A0A2P5TKD5_9GAMM|nr:glucose-6-phosphate isomerase [Oceanisphaera arctica]PPL15541.1 glucose-6-phosphate isomerase [Oceanisphaera arctica]GHA27768.1 glucose-6-phosphate isomerase [Oceanisphaera arctica]